MIGPVAVTDAETLEAIWRLRVSVWRETGSLAPDAFPDGIWRDEVDDAATHWVLRSGGEVVAAARLSIHRELADVWQAHAYIDAGLRLDGPIAAPDRVVVSGPVQGTGAGSRLLEAQDAAATAAGALHAVRQASPAMQRLMERRGWRDVGPAPVDERFPGVGFRVMTRAFGDSEPQLPAEDTSA